MLNQIVSNCIATGVNRIVLHRLVLQMYRIVSHRLVLQMYRIASPRASNVSLMYRWQRIEMRIASASVMEMHIPSTFVSLLGIKP